MLIYVYVCGFTLIHFLNLNHAKTWPYYQVKLRQITHFLFENYPLTKISDDTNYQLSYK
jgi:hypothetical protein